MFDFIKPFLLITLFVASAALAQEATDFKTDSPSLVQHIEIETQYNNSALQTLEEIKQNQNTQSSQYQNVSEHWESVARRLLTIMKNPLWESYPNDPEQDVKEIWQKEVASKFDLLRAIAKTRAKALEIKRARGENIFNWSESDISLIGLELQIIPYKMKAYSLSLVWKIKESFKGGWRGMAFLLKELILLLLLLLLPIPAVRVSKKLVTFMDVQKKKFFIKSFKSQFYRYLTFIISFISPLIPWFVAIIAIQTAMILIESTLFGEFAQLLIYPLYYIYYRIFRLVLENILHSFANTIRSKSEKHTADKIRSSSATLGLFLLFFLSFKQVLYSFLGQSVLFSIIEPFFFWIVIGLIGYVASKWEVEIQESLRQIPWKPIHKLADQCHGFKALFLCVPGAIIIFVWQLGLYLFEWSSRFKIIKSITAKILRIRIESGKEGQNKNQKVAPVQYIKDFRNSISKSSFFVDIDPKFVSKLRSPIDNWLENSSSERTLALYGERGAGKTNILNFIEKTYLEKNYETVRLAIPERTFTLSKLERFIEEHLEIHQNSEQKKIILLDNAHNLFLSAIGGFDVYKKFIDYINEKSEHCFWVVSFNKYSWYYINSVLGNNQYFRAELAVPSWSDESIKQLILDTHALTKYKLYYDRVFQASSDSNNADMLNSSERKFFQLLWEQSKGVPGAAIDLWLKSLRPLHSTTLQVGLPSENDLDVFSGMNNDMFFVYASLIKHDNLHVKEATMATSLSSSLVKQAFNRGIEKGFLEQTDGRYRVTIKWFYDLVRYLRNKNLLYDTNR